MSAQAYWILRFEQRLLTVAADPAGSIFPLGVADDFGGLANVVTVGRLFGRPCLAADLELPPGLPALALTPLRAIFQLAGDEAFALAGRATQLLDWQLNHRYCGRCGAPTEVRTGELAMQCPRCHLVAYPRISPAVMVLVRDGDRLLLARSPHFKPGVFSALAGFVEPGETLEECAAREVYEEVGTRIARLRYFHSQPWPFPNSLMVAFLADHAGGTVTPDHDEIEAAGWFELDRLPLLPEPISIARRLIDAACREISGRGSASA